LAVFEKVIQESEVKWGQFKVLKAMRGFFPSAKTDQRRERITLEVEGKEFNRMFDTGYMRIRGASRIFKQFGIKAGDTVEVDVIVPFQKYRLVFHKQTTSQKSWKV
jgi:hypothetical protein